ncbi:MAG: aminotransferase class V-fold PLP-dependent enzyme [Planctomycetota bacterium]
MPDTLAAFRRAVPAAGTLVYFNHAACAPLPEPVVAAVEEFLHEARRQGSVGFADWLERREQARQRAAAFLGGKPSELAFTTSTSQGLIMLAEGLEFAPGDRIVVIEDDFPSNQIPWYRQRRRGAEVVVVPRQDGRVPVSAVMEAVDERTRVVAVSWVLYDNGFRLDLEGLGAALAERNARAARPALFCVDAIQGLGAFPLDVRACRIDALSADSHKWLMGLEGIGLFWCRDEVQPLLDPPLVSWWSLARPFEAWTPEAELHEDARRFEYASLPTLGLYGMHAALGLLQDTGLERIEERILELTDRLAAGLEERGWQLHSPRALDSERSGILTASHPSMPAKEVAARLGEAGVSVTPRGAGVRFSPHGWNTLDEVALTLERLP